MVLGKLFFCAVTAICLCAVTEAFNADRVDAMMMGDSSESEMESLEEIRELLRQVSLMFETKVANEVGQMKMLEDEEENAGLAGEEFGENDVTLDEEEEEDGNDDVVNLEQDGYEDAMYVEVGEIGVDPNGCKCSRGKCSCCIRVRLRRRKPKKSFCLSVAFLRGHLGFLISLTYEKRVLISKEISLKNPPAICFGLPVVRHGLSVCIQFSELSRRNRTFSGCSRFLVRVFRIPMIRIKLGCFRIRYLDAKQRLGPEEPPSFLAESETAMKGSEPVFFGEVQMSDVEPDDFVEL